MIKDRLTLHLSPSVLLTRFRNLHIFGSKEVFERVYIILFPSESLNLPFNVTSKTITL